MEEKLNLKCKCCSGIGTQMKLDGIRIICPCCDGDGENRSVNRNIKFPPSNLPGGGVTFC